MVGIYLDRVNIHCTTFIPCRRIASIATASTHSFFFCFLASVPFNGPCQLHSANEQHLPLSPLLAKGDLNWTYFPRQTVQIEDDGQTAAAAATVTKIPYISLLQMHLKARILHLLPLRQIHIIPQSRVVVVVKWVRYSSNWIAQSGAINMEQVVRSFYIRDASQEGFSIYINTIRKRDCPPPPVSFVR